MSGFATLLQKEVLRFWKVSTQTIGAPVLTAALFLFIFGHVMEGQGASRRTDLGGEIGEGAQIVPGERRFVGELHPGDLHPVTGIAREADDDRFPLFDRLGRWRGGSGSGLTGGHSHGTISPQR